MGATTEHTHEMDELQLPSEDSGKKYQINEPIISSASDMRSNKHKNICGGVNKHSLFAVPVQLLVGSEHGTYKLP